MTYISALEVGIDDWDMFLFLSYPTVNSYLALKHVPAILNIISVMKKDINYGYH